MSRIHMESLASEMEDKQEYFTLYWQHGERSIIKGNDIEDAFTKAGYGTGAVSAIDWYDEGVSETHHYVKATRLWIKYEPIRIHMDDFAIHKECIPMLLEKHHCVIVEMSNKDECMLSYNFGNFLQLGWVKYLEISYGEYHKGNYGDDIVDEDTDDHHFMAYGTEYFIPEEPSLAVAAFIKRLTSDKPFKESGEGVSLDVIKQQQVLL